MSRSVLVQELSAFSLRLLQQFQMPQEEAQIMTECLIDADRKEITTHGTACLPRYIGLLQSGHMRPKASWDVIRQTGPVEVWDAKRSSGHVIACRAMQKAMRNAETYGIGLVSVKDCNHYGAGGYYAELAAKAGMIGIAASTVSPTMAPWGGAGLVMGNSPLSIAVPTGVGPFFSMDMAQSTVAFSKICQAKEQGVPQIPSGWAYDERGCETTVTADACSGIPAGGHKGFALALAVELIAGCLADGAVGQDAADHARGPAFTVMALNISAFSDYTAFLDRVDCRLEQIKQASPAEGSVFIPGEQSSRKRQQNDTHVVLDDISFEKLKTIAQTHLPDDPLFRDA